jgi:hypothetical protein
MMPDAPVKPESGAYDPDLSARFRLRRRITRISCIAGLLLLMAGGASMSSGGVRLHGIDQVVLWLGLALLVSVFPLYLFLCNRCPGCRTHFSDSPEYSGSDTDGLPLFNRIEKCPFCGLELDGPRHGSAGSV